MSKEEELSRLSRFSSPVILSVLSFPSPIKKGLAPCLGSGQYPDLGGDFTQVWGWFHPGVFFSGRLPLGVYLWASTSGRLPLGVYYLFALPRRLAVAGQKINAQKWHPYRNKPSDV